MSTTTTNLKVKIMDLEGSPRLLITPPPPYYTIGSNDSEFMQEFETFVDAARKKSETEKENLFKDIPVIPTTDLNFYGHKWLRVRDDIFEQKSLLLQHPKQQQSMLKVRDDIFERNHGGGGGGGGDQQVIPYNACGQAFAGREDLTAAGHSWSTTLFKCPTCIFSNAEVVAAVAMVNLQDIDINDGGEDMFGGGGGDSSIISSTNAQETLYRTSEEEMETFLQCSADDRTVWVP